MNVIKIDIRTYLKAAIYCSLRFGFGDTHALQHKVDIIRHETISAVVNVIERKSYRADRNKKLTSTVRTLQWPR